MRVRHVDAAEAAREHVDDVRGALSGGQHLAALLQRGRLHPAGQQRGHVRVADALAQDGTLRLQCAQPSAHLRIGRAMGGRWRG